MANDTKEELCENAENSKFLIFGKKSVFWQKKAALLLRDVDLAFVHYL